MHIFRVAGSVLAIGLFAAVPMLGGCSEESELPESATVGPNPVLPPPDTSYFPRVNIAPAVGWPEDGKPTPASGFEVAAHAKGLDHPRWLYVLPNCDVLVAESNSPPIEDHHSALNGSTLKLALRHAAS